MQRAYDLGIRRLAVEGDSLLVINSMNGDYTIHEHRLKLLYFEAKELERDFQTVDFRHIPRNDNYVADRLAKRGVDM